MTTTSQEEIALISLGGHSNEVIPGVVSSPFFHIYLSFAYTLLLLLNIAQSSFQVSIVFAARPDDVTRHMYPGTSNFSELDKPQVHLLLLPSTTYS
jgi:hypothetical protein